MNLRTPELPSRERRSPSFEEEIANSISHGLGLLLAIAFLIVLLLSASRMGGNHFLVGVSVFGGTMILLYLASTLYHSLTHQRAKHIFRLMDHSAIFLLIAGTYTPFAVGVLRGPWGWTLLTIVWILAVIGVALKVV
ncbi:MAG TPA: hemolysin III family protein, partial [Pyrinomonadaceae bacterium]